MSTPTNTNDLEPGTDSFIPTTPQLTYGQKAVGITFNPGGMPEVNKIKEISAVLIDELDKQRTGNPNDERNNEKYAQFTLAIRKIQEGQMWGVKATTWQY